ncbi:MAG TPA: hypothetical protein EYO33_20440 [Phycisphaerales bacterium]|nr:hypothetical protein [Phycisphaerales bacterium]
MREREDFRLERLQLSFPQGPPDSSLSEPLCQLVRTLLTTKHNLGELSSSRRLPIHFAWAKSVVRKVLNDPIVGV